MALSEQPDRYVSFCNIECDKQADHLIQHLKSQLDALPEANQWKRYFLEKFEQQRKLNHDNLFYVGAQLNTLASFFDEIDDKEGRELLWQLEQQCC